MLTYALIGYLIACLGVASGPRFIGRPTGVGRPMSVDMSDG